jgi:hypothetical protein
MLDSYSAAINKRYRIIRSQVRLWNTRIKKKDNFIQRARADYKGKFHTKSKSRLQGKVSYKEQEPITKENFLQNTGYKASTNVFSERRDLYKSLQLVTLYSGT